MFTWRQLAVTDFPLLGSWLAEPHVARWWNHDPTPEGVARDFGPTARGEEPGEDLVALLDGTPIGLVQRCRIADFAEYVDEFTAGGVELPEGAMSIDYLIGYPDRVGKGVGTRMISAIVEQTWQDHPGADTIIVPVVTANRASWRALEKAGGTRIAVADMPPDNPIDDRAHYVYRFSRRSGR